MCKWEKLDIQYDEIEFYELPRQKNIPSTVYPTADKWLLLYKERNFTLFKDTFKPLLGFFFHELNVYQR